MLPLELFRERGVVVPVVSGFVLNASFYGGVFLLSLFFQEQQHLSAFQAGLMFAPMAIITANFNYLSPKLVTRFGRRAVVVTGLLLNAVGCAGLIAVGADTPRWVTALIMVPLGIGGALAMPALTSQIIDSVETARAGTAGALLNTSRQTGGALAIAVIGVLLAGGFATGMAQSLALLAALLVVMAMGTAKLLPKR